MGVGQATPHQPPTSDALPNLRPSLGPFFNRLPLELRRKILEEAFGHQLIRVYRTRELKAKWNRPAAPSRWRHSLTPRKPPYATHGQLAGAPRKKPGPPPPLGAMGWLLTCRQAYAEGTDVLYSTSKFSLDGEKAMRRRTDARDNTLIHRFCSDLPPRRLASVTSFYLIWQVATPPDFVPDAPGEWRYDAGQLLPFRLVSAVFPGLRQLHVFLMGRMLGTEGQLIHDREEAVLGGVDAFVGSAPDCPKLEVLYVSVTPSMMWGLRRKMTGDEVAWADVNGLAGYSESGFWRPVMESSRPSLRGYWVANGRICR
jgi:hypothetical protein